MTKYTLAAELSECYQWNGARLEFTPVDPQGDIFTATPANSNPHIRDLRIRQHQHEKHCASGSATSHNIITPTISQRNAQRYSCKVSHHFNSWFKMYMDTNMNVFCTFWRIILRNYTDSLSLALRRRVFP